MTHRIAVIPGDGAGPEVVAEARKAVDALGLPIEWEALDWGTARYHAEGAMMPPDALDVRRVLEYAFERAEQRHGVVTSATKSNASRYGYVLWDDVADEIAADHPDVTYERVLVDALAARMVRDPLGLDVVVASNLFGDILTDLAAVLQGAMGMAASASLAPGSGTPGIFEPVHGSAPDIAGQGIANPVGAIWSAALMLESLGEDEAAARLMRALEAVCREGPRTRDVGGSASASEVGDAVAAEVRAG